MKWPRGSWVCLLVAVMVVGLIGGAWGVTLPFEDDFENVALGEYPSGNGWETLLIGQSGYVWASPGKTDDEAFRLDSWPFWARMDGVEVEGAPDRVSYEASVYVDPLFGQSGMVGFMAVDGNGGATWNCFLVDGSTGLVQFCGADWVTVGSYVSGTWCTVRADLDYDALTGDLWVDGELVASGVAICPRAMSCSATAESEQWGVIAPENTNSGSWYPGNVVYFDDLRIWGVEGVATVTVKVDVKPGSESNPINLRSRGLLPVAIFSEAGFDAMEIVPSTVTVAGASVAVRGRRCQCMAHEEDVDGDGLMDLLVQVETRALDAAELASGYAVVSGETYGGEPFEGSDEVTVVRWP